MNAVLAVIFLIVIVLIAVSFVLLRTRRIYGAVVCVGKAVC